MTWPADPNAPQGAVGGRFELLGPAVAIWVIGREERCKDIRCGGSHYHCTGCGAVTSMTGHPDPRQCELARHEGRGDPDWVEVEQ